MQVLIHGRSYQFSADVLSQSGERKGYFKLAKKSFGLKFDTWYQSGYWDSRFIPYVLYDGRRAVSSVAVCINEVLWKNTTKRYVQISTVMTLPKYRNRGLNRWLMEQVLSEWKDKCDAIYLLANDSVVDFYPKFGFEKYTEYDFTIPVAKVPGEYRKLDVSNADDLALLIEKYELSNPFTQLKVKNLGLFMLHCLCFRANDIYFIEQYDAIAIVEHRGNQMVCHEILAPPGASLGDILGVLARENTESAYLGFTPEIAEGCSVVESQEEDNHLFVFSGKDNIFKGNQIMFPLLSRA